MRIFYLRKPLALHANLFNRENGRRAFQNFRSSKFPPLSLIASVHPHGIFPLAIPCDRCAREHSISATLELNFRNVKSSVPWMECSQATLKIFGNVSASRVPDDYQRWAAEALNAASARSSSRILRVNIRGGPRNYRDYARISFKHWK